MFSVDGSTIVTKQSKQVTKVGGLGATSYDINKASAGQYPHHLDLCFQNFKLRHLSQRIKLRHFLDNIHTKRKVNIWTKPHHSAFLKFALEPYRNKTTVHGMRCMGGKTFWRPQRTFSVWKHLETKLWIGHAAWKSLDFVWRYKLLLSMDVVLWKVQCKSDRKVKK